MRSSIPSTRKAACPACGGRALALAVDTNGCSLANRARAFHSARLRSRSCAELDERASFTQGDAAALLRCNECGTCCAGRNRVPIRPCYLCQRSLSRGPARGDDRLASVAYRRKVPILRRLLGRCAPRIVEVGSFVGGFLEVARTVGWSAVGVDPNPQLAESCRSRGLGVVEGTLDEFATREGRTRCDALTIWNTFDQLADPQEALATAAKLLRPDGILALRVPHGFAFETLHAHFERARGPGRRFLEACLAWNNSAFVPVPAWLRARVARGDRAAARLPPGAASGRCAGSPGWTSDARLCTERGTRREGHPARLDPLQARDPASLLSAAAVARRLLQARRRRMIR